MRLGAKLRELAAERVTAERELENLNLRKLRLEDLKRDKECLLNDYANMVPEALDELTGEERHQVYQMLRLQVYVSPDGDLDVRGVLREAVCAPTDTRSSQSVVTKPTEVRFRTFLNRDGAEPLELMKAD
jgi:hypothetical protein